MSLFANYDEIMLQETIMMNGEGGLADNHSGSSMSHENGHRSTAATTGKQGSTTDHHTGGNLDGGALFVLESKGT